MALSDIPSRGAARRSQRLDLLRAFAMVWMAAFHLGFDLNHFGLIAPQNFYDDPRWTLQRTAIVALFLFTAGAAQSVAGHDPERRRFWRRWAQIVACAGLVSLGSWAMFPQRWISFGVLHGMAVMLLVLRAVRRWPTPALLALAAVAFALPSLGSHPVFDQRWTWWTGLVTRKPPTEDFVPVLPWIGVMLTGFLTGRVLQQRRPQTWQGPVPRGTGPWLKLSQWPLTFYMLHQPVLIGLVLAVRTLAG
jgi:uncharacterized membrane protein